MVEKPIAKRPYSSSDEMQKDTFPTVSRDSVSESPFKRTPPVIESYELLSYLGEGGMGTVWKARQISVDREVALKFLPVDKLGSEARRTRFEREVKLAAHLNHENIASVYDSGIHNGIYFYAMELIPGIHLDEYVRQKNLSELQILSLIEKVCRAVEHAHRHGVIHRDLKPSNILVTDAGKPYVVDFGIAKIYQEQEENGIEVIDFVHQEKLNQGQSNQLSQTVTGQGAIVGSLVYMSPEQARGENDKISTQSDIYSLGVILYYLLLGKYPHRTAGDFETVRESIAKDDIILPHTIRPSISKKLEDLLCMALRKDPEHRYAHIGDLIKDLRNYPNGPLICHPLGNSEILFDKFRKYYLPMAITITLITIIFIVGVLSLRNTVHINTFSLYDLVGLIAGLPLAIIFFALYFTQEKRLRELLYGGCAICTSFFCLLLFLTDNSVPFGALAAKFPQAADENLLYLRLSYIVFLCIQAMEVHFVMDSCAIKFKPEWKILLLYPLHAAFIPLVLSDAFLIKRTIPIAEQSGWFCVVPWFPVAKPAIYLYYIAILATQITIQIMLYRRKKIIMATGGSLSQVNLLRLGFGIVALGGIIDGLMGVFGVALISSFPLTMMLWGFIIAIALVQERIASNSQDI